MKDNGTELPLSLSATTASSFAAYGSFGGRGSSEGGSFSEEDFFIRMIIFMTIQTLPA